MSLSATNAPPRTPQFRMCWTHVARGSAGSGLHETRAECIIGDKCTVDGAGIGVTQGDQMMVKMRTCDENASAAGFDWPATATASSVGVLKFAFGPVWSRPGLHVKCWCSRASTCSAASDFAAAAGALHMLCAPGRSRARTVGAGDHGRAPGIGKRIPLLQRGSGVW